MRYGRTDTGMQPTDEGRIRVVVGVESKRLSSQGPSEANCWVWDLKSVCWG